MSSNLLLHSPADVVAQALVDEGVGSDPSGESAWPVFVTKEPSTPDNCLTVTDTTGVDHGRVMSGELQGHRGVQVRIRARTQALGFRKATALRVFMSEGNAAHSGCRNLTVTLDGVVYLLRNFAKIGDVLSIGSDTPNSMRRVFTLNATVLVEYVSGSVS